MSFQHKNQKIVLGSVPSMEDLCAINIKLMSDVDEQILSNSRCSYSSTDHNTTYSRTVMACRKLIFLDILVLASPIDGAGDVFIAIVPKSHLMDIAFLELLTSLNLEVAYQRSSFDPALLETCLKYTIGAKLAPTWNKAGNLFIEGCRFLQARGRQNAVEFDVNVRDDEACLNLSFYHVTLTEFKLEELVDFQTKIDEFLTLKIDSLNEIHFTKRWCHVLPSMKKGEIGLVTRNIPPGGLFNNYEELKTYWENMYGYILPERECENLYFHVHFRMLGSNSYTYPSCCLQLHQPLQVPFAPQKTDEYMVRFFQDLQTHIPTICGDNWLGSDNVYRPRLYLQSAGSDANHIRSENEICIEKIQSKVAPHRPSQDTVSVKASLKTMPESIKLPEVKPSTKGRSGESASDAYVPRFNLFQRSQPVQRTPYLPSIVVAAAFGSCQQPKLNITTTNCPLKQIPHAGLPKSSPFGGKCVPMQREVMKTILKVGQPISSQDAVKTNTVNADLVKTSKEKLKEQKEDIVLLAQKNKLSKVSNVNLLRWLREMGVPCSTKIRKAELINKVTKAVQMLAPEQ